MAKFRVEFQDSKSTEIVADDFIEYGFEGRWLVFRAGGKTRQVKTLRQETVATITRSEG